VAEPALNDIHYIGSPENAFLLEQYIQQQRLMNKASAISAAVWEYTPQESLYEALFNEKQALEKRFAELQNTIAKSPLYAARVRQMSDYCGGIGSRLDLTENEFREEQRHYVRDVLDFEQLWNSGLWKMLFANWIGIEATLGDEMLLEDSKAILARLQDEDIRGTVLKKMVLLFHQYGKEGLVTQLGIEDLLAPGHKAPKLYLPDNTYIIPFNSVVIFYESDCNNCENELIQLRGNYPIFQERNIRIISVSADTEDAAYRKNADLFPWQQKICDFKGFEGVNFKNYAIMATPMIFMIDKEGNMKGR
jgi:hypothetical protein